jgi:hypothetical protein
LHLFKASLLFSHVGFLLLSEISSLFYT